MLLCGANLCVLDANVKLDTFYNSPETALVHDVNRQKRNRFLKFVFRQFANMAISTVFLPYEYEYFMALKSGSRIHSVVINKQIYEPQMNSVKIAIATATP